MRNVSMTVPAPSSRARRARPARPALRWGLVSYQRSRAAGMAYRSDTTAGPEQRASRTTSGCASRRYARTASMEPSLPRLPWPSRPNRPTLRPADSGDGVMSVAVAVVGCPRQLRLLSGHGRANRHGVAAVGGLERHEVPGRDLAGGSIQRPLDQVAVALPPIRRR